jgi:hypothetical protein
MFEAEAIELLGRKVADEGFLVVPQVRNAVGARGRTTADALMIQTWPSRTLGITGVEYKRSRHDWRRELRDGPKAEPVAAYCHFWLVLAPKGIIPLEEVPAGWGLYEFDDRDRLLRTKPPPAQESVKPLDLAFVAAILRAAEAVNRSEATLAADRAKLRQEFDERLERTTKERRTELTRLREKVEIFEEKSGIKIASGWGLERLAEGLVEFLKDPDQFRGRLRRDREGLQRMIELTDEILGGDK